MLKKTTNTKSKLEISKSKLKLYKNSKEFKEIVSKAKNRANNIENRILEIYDKGIQDNTLTKNEFDIRNVYISVLEDFISQIKKPEGKLLREYYEQKIDNATKFLFVAINQMGMSNSILRYTDLDLDRFRRNYLLGIEYDIDFLIGQNVEKVNNKDGAF